MKTYIDIIIIRNKETEHTCTQRPRIHLRMGTSIEEQKVLSGADPFDVYNHNNIHKDKVTKQNITYLVTYNIRGEGG